MALCTCRAGDKILLLRIADRAFEQALAACGEALPPVGDPASSLLKPAAKRHRGDGSPNNAAHKASAAVCSECGRHAGRGGLLRCMGCDAAFHRKCADATHERSRDAAEVCLCPSCWDAQR
jgi:hypothetical protein